MLTLMQPFCVTRQMTINGSEMTLVIDHDDIAVAILSADQRYTPSAVTLTFVPIGAAKSTPLCERHSFRTGWKRELLKPELTRENSIGERKKALRTLLPSGV